MKWLRIGIDEVYFYISFYIWAIYVASVMAIWVEIKLCYSGLIYNVS